MKPWFWSLTIVVILRPDYHRLQKTVRRKSRLTGQVSVGSWQDTGDRQWQGDWGEIDEENIYYGVSRVRKRQQGMLKPWTRICRHYHLKELLLKPRGVRTAAYPNPQPGWRNTASAKRCRVNARAKRPYPLGPVSSLSELSPASAFGQTQWGAKGVGSPTTEAVCSGRSPRTPEDRQRTPSTIRYLSDFSNILLVFQK